MKKFIRNTAIAALALTVAATGAVYMPVPFVDNQNVSVTESVGENILSLASQYSASNQYEVYLESFDAAKKIAVIKAVRAATGLGLYEAKPLVESVLTEGSKLVIQTEDKSKAEQARDDITAAGGTVKYLVPEGGGDPTPTPSDTSSTENFEKFFAEVPNKFIVHDGEAKSFIKLNCDKEVVYEVHVVSTPPEALDKFANATVLGVSEWVKWFEDYPRCGYVLEPNAADPAFGERFGVSVQLSNTETSAETPEIMPLGYADSTSGNGITATPLSKVPGKKQLLTMLIKYVNGTINAVFDNKADADKFAEILKKDFYLDVEITPFSRLSYDGQTYNWVPSSIFETEYNKMISAIKPEKTEGEETEGEEPESEKTEGEEPEGEKTEGEEPEGEKTEGEEPEGEKTKFGYCWEECLPMYWTVAVPASAAPGVSGGTAPVEEATEFTVTLESFDAAKKIPVIKAVREITNLGLGEAKALVEGAPKVLKEGVSKADAERIIKKIEAAGGKASAPGLNTGSSISFTDPNEITVTPLSNPTVQANLILLSNETEVNDWVVTLESFNAAKKIAVIKAIREATDMGLGEAKAIVESAPKVVKEGLSKSEAEEIVKKIEEAGGKASSKGTEPDEPENPNGSTPAPQASCPSYDTKSVVIITSYDDEKENDVIAKVAEVLKIEEEQAANIVKFKQIVKTFSADNYDPEELLQAIKEADDSIEFSTKAVENVATPMNYVPSTTYSIGASGAGSGAAEEEQTEFTVILESFDAAKKIPVIKAVREITGLGLGEAKALVEGAPKTLKEGVSKADADEMIKKIEEAGGKASKK